MQVERQADETGGSKVEKRKGKFSPAELVDKAQRAMAGGQSIFYGKGEGIPVKEGGTLFYNAARSKLAGML